MWFLAGWLLLLTIAFLYYVESILDRMDDLEEYYDNGEEF